MKSQNVITEKWQYLILFDACRYDYFEKYYKKYFTGTLEKRKSPATWTLEWLEKTFVDYYHDIAYISSSSFCDSRKPISLFNHSFNPKKHFIKIYNSWDPKDDPELFVTPADKINQMARINILKHPNWRFVIHYFQPHMPTVEYEKLFHEKIMSNIILKNGKKTMITNKITNSIIRLLGNSFIWKFKNFYNIPPFTYEEIIWREKGTNGYVEGYIKNLEYVMEHAKTLIDHLPPGKVVITSDHGELLGEKNNFGHGVPLPRLPQLTEIPWFIVKRN